MIEVAIEILAFVAGGLLGFAIEYFLGDALAVLFAFFTSSTRELNTFWIGYLIGVAVAHVKRTEKQVDTDRKNG